MPDITTKTITRRVVAIEEREACVPIRLIRELLGADAPPAHAEVGYVDDALDDYLRFTWREETTLPDAPLGSLPVEIKRRDLVARQDPNGRQRPVPHLYKQRGLPRPDKTVTEVILDALRTGPCRLSDLHDALDAIGWNPTSTIPALAYLGKLGIAGTETQDGVTRHVLLREPTPDDDISPAKRKRAPAALDQVNGAES